MSYDQHDADYEEGIELLYKEFKQQYEDEFTFDRIHAFYKENSDIAKNPLNNLKNSEILFRNQFYSAALIHAAISIETGIKTIVLKPILYSLAFDGSATELLYKFTFRQKSLSDIPKDYYQILNDLTGTDFKSVIRQNTKSNLWEELNWLQDLRNKVLHQGIAAEKSESEKAIQLAKFVYNEIIPAILDRFNYHIDKDKISYGRRDRTK